MPFARLEMHKLIGGTLLALACGGASAVSAQTAGVVAASPFSGTYIGTVHKLAGSDANCQAPSQISLAVQDGRFKLPWHDSQAFNVKIAPNGSFYATSGSVLAQSDKHMMLQPTVQGSVSHTSLVADYGTRWCHLRLDAVRS
jgi:hypothetical protein